MEEKYINEERSRKVKCDIRFTKIDTVKVGGADWVCTIEIKKRMKICCCCCMHLRFPFLFILIFTVSLLPRAKQRAIDEEKMKEQAEKQAKFDALPDWKKKIIRKRSDLVTS